MYGGNRREGGGRKGENKSYIDMIYRNTFLLCCELPGYQLAEEQLHTHWGGEHVLSSPGVPATAFKDASFRENKELAGNL